MRENGGRLVLIGALLAAAGAALFPISHVAAVVVGALGLVPAQRALVSLHLPHRRLAFLGISAAHGAVIAAASHAPLLGIAIVLAAISQSPTELVIRRFGYHTSWQFPLGLVVASGLTLGAAWTAGPWTLAVLPGLGFFGWLTAGVMAGHFRRLRSNRPSWSVQIGETLPEIRMPLRDGGGEFLLGQAPRGHVLLCFLRSEWCPVCHMQIRIYQREAALLAQSGIQLVIVSPEARRDTFELAEFKGLEVLWAIDEGCRVADLLGARQTNAPGKAAPVPASFLVGPDRTLLLASRPTDINAFLDPREVVRFLQGAAAAAA